MFCGLYRRLEGNTGLCFLGSDTTIKGMCSQSCNYPTCVPNPTCTVSNCTGVYNPNGNVSPCAGDSCETNTSECCFNPVCADTDCTDGLTRNSESASCPDDSCTPNGFFCCDPPPNPPCAFTDQLCSASACGTTGVRTPNNSSCTGPQTQSCSAAACPTFSTVTCSAGTHKDVANSTSCGESCSQTECCTSNEVCLSSCGAGQTAVAAGDTCVAAVCAEG
jgi:hypothetical protein